MKRQYNNRKVFRPSRQTLMTLRCLFTVRITWLYSTPLLCMRACGLVVWLSLRVANIPGSRRTTILCSIGYFFYCLQCFVLFALFFTQWLIYPFSFHIDIVSHINFYSQFSQFIRRCKDCNACINWWCLCIVLLRKITKNTTDRNIANFSVLLLILEKVPGKGAFFFSSVWQLYIRDFKFKIWIENKLKKNVIEEKVFLPLRDYMVKFPWSVISESWKISKSLLVTISKVTK